MGGIAVSRPKTAIEKSHSKWSNCKLTLLSLAATIGFCTIFAALALRPWLSGTWFGVTAGSGVVVTVLTVIGFIRFTR